MGEELNCDPWGGKVQRRGVYQGATHLFGSVAPLEEFPQLSYLPIPEGGTGWWPKCPDAQPCAITWLVSLTGLELQRNSEDAVPLAPLDESLFHFPNALPAGVSRSRQTQLKAVITANVGSGERRFFCDLNQSIELQAGSVSVDWMAPSNAANSFVNAGTANVRPIPVPTRIGFVVDALVGVEVARIEDPIGLRDVHFTNHLIVAADTRGTIVVPPFATKLTIYQAATLGSASTQWEMHYGDPAILTSIEHGTIPFIPGARKTEPEIDLGDVEFLRTDQDDENRFFTLRWTIRP